MKSPMWNLEKMFEQLAPALLPPPTGSRVEQGLELIRRCDARDASLATRAIEAERAGDEECCWACMHLRSENKRVRDKIAADVAEIQNSKAVLNPVNSVNPF